MLIRTITGLLFLVIMMLPLAATAQESAEFPVLDATSYSRDFAGRTVRTEFVARAGGSLDGGQRGYLLIDLNTTLSGNDLDMPRAVVINGFVTVALPPGLEPDGPPRLMFFDSGKGRYDYLYSKAYPDLIRFEGLTQAIGDTTSGNPGKMLLGLDSIVGILDPRVFISPPTDKRLTGQDKDYAITGVSWLIPCNVQFKELVGLFDPATGLERTARLRVRLPLKTVSPLTNTKIVIYAGGLSSAVNHVSLLPADIPANALPLAPLPDTLTNGAAVTPEGASATDSNAEDNADDPPPPEGIKINSDGQDEAPQSSIEASGTDAPSRQVPIPTLVYSHEWLYWEVELDLACLLPVSAPTEQPRIQQLPAENPAQQPIDLDGEINIVPVIPPTTYSAPPDENVVSSAPADATAQVVAPPAEAPVVQIEAPAEAQSTESAVQETVFTPTPQGNTEVRQVEPGTLPAAVDSYTVALKPITGTGSGKPRPNRPVSAGASTPANKSTPNAGYVPGSYNPPSGLGEMVLIPEGYFLMGTASNASAGDADEMPQTQVYLPAYYIDKYPVTNRQFYEFCLSAGFKPDGKWDKYYSQGTADLPVRGVTWEDATAFARWAGKRLPTEAEWEKASRGDDGRTYPWGEDWSSSILPRGEYLHDIMTAQSAASPYGVFGMVGLVWQWTASALHEYPFNPDARGDKRVLRGGAFSNGRNIVRCANRYSESPNVALNTFSFRCVKDAP